MNKKFITAVIANVITIVIAIITGAVWIGNLQGQLSALNPESIKQEKNKAIKEIKTVYSSLLKKRNKVYLYNDNDLKKIINNLMLKDKTLASLKDIIRKVESLNDLVNQNKLLIKEKNGLITSKIKLLEENVKDTSLSLNDLNKSLKKEKSQIRIVNNNISSLKEEIKAINNEISKLSENYEDKIRKLNTRIVELEKKAISIDTKTIIKKGKTKTGAITMTNNVEKKNDNVPMIKEYDGFIFSLQKCQKIGSSIKCNFLITSKGQDRKLYIFGPRHDASIMFDNFNNKYERPGGIQLANCSNNFQCIMTLLSGIPTRASITFSGIANNAEYVALLKLHFRGDGRIPKSLIFRNIPLH